MSATPASSPLPATLHDASVEDAILRESLRSRCRQARPAVLALVLNTGLGVPVFGRGLPRGLLAAWLVLLVVLLLIRYFTARKVERRLDAPRAELEVYDRRFRLLSLLGQAAFGAGIWMVPGSTAVAAPYWMTMWIAIYGVGTIVNLAHDFRSLKLTLPVLMAQPALYWATTGIEGIVIAVILTGITWLMITSARNSMNAFVASIRIRFEKDALLGQLTVEKQATSRALEAAEQANQKTNVALEAAEQANQKTQVALEAAERANRQKSFFLAAASHDLRQPLYAVSLLGGTISLHPLAPEVAALVEKQREALKVVTDMFDNILDLSRFEAGAVPRALRPFPLAAFLAEMESEHRSSVEAKGLTLEVGICGATVVSDYKELARLVRNLLSNAIRYTESGGIRMFAEEHDDAVSIVVEDTGIGIPEAERERVFKEFQQLDNPQRSRERGLGLGLAIVRQIAQLLEHPVKLTSEVGKGTRVEVRVPLEQGDERCLSPDVGRALEVGGPPAMWGTQGAAEELDPLHLLEQSFGLSTSRTGLQDSLAGVRAWIVEDDPLVRDALQEYLALQGCVLRLALDRPELEHLIGAEGLPDFVILDDMLGTGETGLELAGWLAERVPQTHVLVTTGNVSPERWTELNASGLAVLRKPVSPAAISDWMRRGLAGPDRAESRQ